MFLSQRITRKAAIAAAILGATLILPGSAVASHNPGNHRDPYTCDPAAEEPNPSACPAFEPSGFFKVQNQVRNTPSGLTLEFSQTDLRMPVMKAEYLIPSGWRFGLSELDEAVDASGVPATDCSQIYNTDGSIASAGGGRGRAELVSADTGMIAQIEGERFSDPPSGNEALNQTGLFKTQDDPPPTWGYRTHEPSSSAQRRYPSVTFLRWDGTTARFCYMHRNHDGNNNDTQPHGSLNEIYIGEFTMTRLAGDPDFDWKVELDTAYFHGLPNAADERSTIMKHTIGLGSLTAGNRNLHPITGEKSKATFSRSPADAGLYTFRANLYTCDGAIDQSDPTGCDGGAYSAPVSVDQQFHIATAPDNVRHNYARLTSPANADLCQAVLCDLVMGQDSFEVTWDQPSLPSPEVEVRGFVLTVARPGDQGSRKHYRVITDPDDAEFDASVCGATGTDSCAFTVSLPTQSTDGTTTLTPEGKYHLALVTIYQSNLRRTDGLCDTPGDDGSGVICPASVAPLEGKAGGFGNLEEPGLSYAQVLMRPHVYPLVYAIGQDDTNNSSYDPELNTMLLLDYSGKRGEWIEWVNNDDVTIYAGISNLIVGDNDAATGVFSFGSNTQAGSTQNWSVDGFTDPACGCAWGISLSWDLKNPGLNPPTIAGYPTADFTIFQFGRV